MSNPLARVVMSNVAQKSGKVERRSSSSTNRAVRGKSEPNLGRQEKQLLSSLLNGNAKVDNNRSIESHNKNTYGRGSNVASNKSQTIKTLDSLVPGGLKKTETNIRTNDRKKDCVVDRSRPNLKSLCSLDNISIGKSGIESRKTNTNRPVSKPRDNKSSDNRRDRDRDMINKLNLDDLARGKNMNTSTSSSKRASVNTSTNKSSSGMTTLGALAGDKTKNSQKQDKKTNKTVKQNNSYVKSSVINNLEAYIPKVSLESIGKGSLL